jgi:hypothetical protein
VIVHDAHSAVVKCIKLLHQQDIAPISRDGRLRSAEQAPTMTALGLPALDCRRQALGVATSHEPEAPLWSLKPERRSWCSTRSAPGQRTYGQAETKR